MLLIPFTSQIEGMKDYKHEQLPAMSKGKDYNVTGFALPAKLKYADGPGYLPCQIGNST